MKKITIGKMPQLPFEMSEAINQLRVNLSFCGSNVKTIMVTSSTPNEGKSFVTMQLWRMIAELGTPTLLIDCDFRKSEIRRKYGLSTSGHLLGGAGGIEAVFTALALHDQFAPPTIHYEQPDPECDLDYVPNVGREMKMEYALSNSLGFGGHNACLAFKKWEG